MISKETVEALVLEELKDSDSYLVEISIKPGNMIVVEIDNDEGVDIDECVKISKHIEESLDREVEDFELEVGSAGLTSPFKILRQYQKNIGNPVEVLSRKGEKMSGTLKSADADKFTVTIIKKEKPEGAKRKMDVAHDIDFGYDDVKYVKYKF